MIPGHLVFKFRFGLLFIFSLCVFIEVTLNIVYAQKHNYNIDVSNVSNIVPKPLNQMGGVSPSGGKVEVNNYYISIDDRPIIPVTGEFHYSRYPNQYWDESIKKMKAGGINMIATYVFWNIHEEKEWKFDWTADKDLKKFIELCRANEIAVIVRICPFDHGEIRSGGLPDWLLGKPLTVRTNDPGYLHYVELLYNEIGKQLKGLYYKDGGPIVGVQLENEYQHLASPWGLIYTGQPYDLTVADRDRNTAQEGVGIAKANNPYAELGNDHLRALKTLALKAGIDAPLYTATGWGNAAIIPNETLPVTAAYAYPTWTAKRELSPFYLYQDLHSLPDYAPVRYKPMDYPAFAAELGAGIMTTYSRRPIVPAESVEALVNRCLGGGANGIGYYMYHGGSTPTGRYDFSDEAYGYPKVSYDFQAPIGEYGQTRASYDLLKPIHFFINDFADLLAPMVTVLPANSAGMKPENITDLRYAVRTNGDSGFLFLNNFQDNITNEDHTGINISIKNRDGSITIPEAGGFTLKAKENTILPFNLDMNGSKLIYATAQLVCKNDGPTQPYYVFLYADGIVPEFCFSKGSTAVKVVSNIAVTQKGNKIYLKQQTVGNCEFVITGKNGLKTSVLVVSKEMATHAFLTEMDGFRHVLFSHAEVLPEERAASFLSLGKNEFSFSVFPKLTYTPELSTGIITPITNKLFSEYQVVLPAVDLKPQTVKTGTRKVSVTLPDKMPEGLNDLFLNVDYVGDTAMGFLNGDLICDEFYKGIPWQIGLKRFIGKGDQFGLYFRPLMKNASYMIDLPAQIEELAKKADQTLMINELTYTPEYETMITFK